MIPILAVLRVGRHRPCWIPIPLFLIWLLLLPLCLLALPFYFAGCRALKLPAGRTLRTGLALFRALGGTRVEIQHPDAAMAIRFI
jgi:hypothetical protein